MRRNFFYWILCFLFLGGEEIWSQGTTTLTSRAGSTNGNQFYSGNDIYIDYSPDHPNVLGGGCMWLYTKPEESSPSYWVNDVFLKGYGYIKEDGTLENTGALRFGEGSQTYTTPVVLTGDVTLLADASIGVEVANNCDLHAYITGELKTSGEEGKNFTLRRDASSDLRGGTLVIIHDNTNFTANWDLRQGVLQVGAKDIKFNATGYEWTEDSEPTLKSVEKSFSFDGTTGGLGSGGVTIASVATLKFVRSNDYNISNAISGTGKIVFSGGGHGTLTGSIAESLASIEIEAGTTLQAAPNAITTSITGKGFYQLHYSGEKMQNVPNLTNLNGFSGVLLLSGDNRWGIGSDLSAGSYAIGAIDDAQIWVTGNVDIQKDLYLSGNGWHSNERFGALRLAGNAVENADGGFRMSHITGNVTLLGDTRISARHGEVSTTGMISGNISGQYNLSTGGNVAGTLILTGENSYVNTHVTGTTTLQIGYVGKINNNREFDGTQGTLGTGGVNIDPSATLKFVRTNTLAIGNDVTGGGSIVFDGGGNYSWEGDITKFTGTWNVADGTLTVGENQTFPQSITVGANGELAGMGTVENLIMDGGKIHSTLTFTQDDFTLHGTWATTLGKDSEPITFAGEVQVLPESVLEIFLMEDFSPEIGDSFFLLAGNELSFQNLDLNTLSVSSTLPGDLFWTLGIGEYGDGLGLYAHVSVPEPSSWLLILAGGIWIFRGRIRRKC